MAYQAIQTFEFKGLRSEDKSSKKIIFQVDFKISRIIQRLVNIFEFKISNSNSILGFVDISVQLILTSNTGPVYLYTGPVLQVVYTTGSIYYWLVHCTLG